MKCVIEFQHFDLPRTPNMLLGAPWQVRAGESRRWQRIVWKYTWHLKPAQPLVHAVLTFTRASSGTLDPDNLPGSFKAVMDALKKCGIISDDTHGVVGAPTYLQEKAPPGKGFIRVKVEGLV